MHDTIPADGDLLPLLDEDGLLRVGDHWVAIPDAQLPVVALLVDRYGRLVRKETLTAAYVEAGNSGDDASIRSLIARIGRRVARLGLRLHTVRGRGVMLDREGQAR
jgi:DNA-binding winged helix-turn-helix (wHTH) protein